MENTTFFFSYLLTFVVCMVITVGVLLLIKNGLKRYFENLSQDSDITKFFYKLTNLIILIGGMDAALTSSFDREDANWLTLTWDIADQLQAALSRLFLN
ncbi:hypothetical protein ACFLRI_01875 [Bacteroidota bacterium]